MIERNTTIPTKKSEIFTTAEDGQTTVEVHVLQGERPMAASNRTLGRFHLVDIPPAPRGIPQIDVTFDIDVDGIVHVSAKDMATEKEQSMTVTGGSALSKDEIDKMMREAESHAEEDKRKKEEAEARNEADNLVYGTEKSLREVGDKLGSDDKSKIEVALNEVKEALKGSDIEKIKSATENLKQASYKMAEVVYAQQQAQQQARSQAQAGGGTEAQAEEGEVVDADYEVVDEGEDEKKK
jgi:molecular chaperone DnaK